MDWIERYWAKVDRRGDAECWPWTGARLVGPRGGYGVFSLRKGSHVRAHRIAWWLFNGPIPAGLLLDHVRARGCTRRDCCNPGHLEPVTERENLRRGDSPSGVNARKTACKRGHGFTAESTYVRPNGRRECRVCRAAGVGQSTQLRGSSSG